MPGLPLKNPWTRPIPNPSQDLPNLFACVSALKETVESLIGQRGRSPNRAVTFNDLTAMGVLTQEAVASPGGSFAAGTYQAGSGIAINTGTTPPTISTAVPYLPLTGGTITGPLIIQNDVGGGYGGQMALVNNAAGATNPAKYLRVSPAGTIEIVNSAFTAVRFQLFDTGDFVAGGNITFGGPYLYGVNATGTVNSTGGPFIYFDSNYIIPHLGPGNLGFQVQNTSGGNVGGFGGDGWLLGLGGRRVAYNDGNYTQIKDGSDRTALQLGSTLDPQNYYRQGAHVFQGVNGATYTHYIDSGGVTLQNASAFRGRKTDSTIVNLAYVYIDNTIHIASDASLQVFIGYGGGFFDGNGGFWAANNIVLKNNLFLFGCNTAGTPYQLMGVNASNRLLINPSSLGVDAGGQWSFGGAVIVPNSIAFLSRKADNTLVNLAYIDNTNNVIIGGYGSALPCFVGSGGSYFNGAGDLYAAQHVVLKNGFSLFAGNAAATGNYPVIGVGSDNRIKINSSVAYNVDAAGIWNFSSAINVAGGISSTGSVAGFFTQDRSTAGLTWGIYGSGSLLRFWNSAHSDIATMDSNGNLFLLNGNFLYGKHSNGTDLQLCGVLDRNYFGNLNLDTYIRAAGWCYFAGHPVPVADNTYVCGYPASAWNGVFSYAYPGPSDVRLKHEIEDLPDDCLDLVRAITPRRYKFRNAPEQDRDRKRWGFIAQEVAEAMAARGHDFGGHFIGDDPAQSQALDHSDLLAVLWHAIKELAARVAALETKS